ncbi:hypothetical protein V6N13_078572 [Hibiscus sabdariffa]
MESKKLGLLVVATAVVVLAAMAPPVTAARFELKPLSIITDANIRNPLANIYWVDMPVENCLKRGSFTGDCAECCSQKCQNFAGARPICF